MQSHRSYFPFSLKHNLLMNAFFLGFEQIRMNTVQNKCLASLKPQRCANLDSRDPNKLSLTKSCLYCRLHHSVSFKHITPNTGN